MTRGTSHRRHPGGSRRSQPPGACPGICRQRPRRIAGGGAAPGLLWCFAGPLGGQRLGHLGGREWVVGRRQLISVQFSG